MHNLTTLIKRLEAATSRLEDTAAAFENTNAATATPKAVATEPLELVPAPAPAPQVEPLPPKIEAFDALIKGDVRSFVDIGERIGGLIAEQSKAVLEAFQAERTFIYVTTKAKKPDQQPPELTTELQKASDTINNLLASNKGTPLRNHLSTVAEGSLALKWVSVQNPVDFLDEMVGTIEYWGNMVLREYKAKDTTHVQFIQAYYRIFKSLASYLRTHYPNGLTWNSQSDTDALEALRQIQSDAGSGKAAPPPPPPPPPPASTFSIPGGPPPPPPPPLMGGPLSTSSAPATDMSAVFAELNRGDTITSNLRKVNKSEMTHKNPSLRAGSTVPERSSSQGSVVSSHGKASVPGKKPKPNSMRVKRPPRKQLEGSKWLVENFDNQGDDIVEIGAQQNQSILISRCSKTIVKVSNKANAISIDNCNGLSIIIDSLVSSLEVIKSPNFAIQVNGVVPTLLLDQVDGATLYLSAESLGTEIFTSKCTNVNVLLPPKEEADDDKECPIPEQIKSYVKDGVLVSEIVEHAV
jgi:adenylyl cyclase-associated protein